MSDEGFGDYLPSNPQYTPERVCGIVVGRVRAALVRRVLRRVGRLPSEEEISRTLLRKLPAPETLEKHFSTLNSQQSALEEALLQSEVDPTRDYSIWQTLVAKHMPYDRWVQYRTEMRGQRPTSMRLPTKLSEAQLLESARGMRAQVVEEVFQRWLETEWAPQNPEEKEAASVEAGGIATHAAAVSPTASLQLRFWRKELAVTSVAILPEWRCPQIISPGDLIAPEVRWPVIPK